MDAQGISQCVSNNGRILKASGGEDIGVSTRKTLQTTSESDALVLQAIASSIPSLGWNISSTDPCFDTWKGLTCDDDGFITQITYDGSTLGHLGGMKKLLFFFLKNFLIYNEIPLFYSGYRTIRTTL